jgi:hypothetical protein
LRPRYLGRTHQSAADRRAKACDTGEAQEIPPRYRATGTISDLLRRVREGWTCDGFGPPLR